MAATPNAQAGADLAGVLAGSRSSLVIGSLLETLMKKWNGFDGFANAYFREFDKALPGSIARQRMLDGVLRLVIQQTSLQKGQSKTELEAMSDQDIRRELDAMLGERLARQAAQPKPTPPPAEEVRDATPPPA